jgi:hypothetical protein
MFSLTGSSGFRRSATLAAAALTALFGVMASVSATSASSVDTVIKARYPVSGTTLIKAANFTLPLGPGTLSARVSVRTGKVTANLKLPNATGTFLEFGLIPVTATAALINDGPTTGSVNLSTGAVQTTSTITLQLVDLKVAGVDVPVGPSCETSPTTVSVASEAGFSILKGGNLGGTYTIPPFSNCLLATPLINLTIPGSGNTITLTLGKPHFGS